jgi:hypothetical protein
MTYNRYALPRIEALTRSKLLAVVLVNLWWASSTVLFLSFWTGNTFSGVSCFPARVVLICLFYLRIRRLAPLILAHWAMDLMGARYTRSIFKLELLICGEARAINPKKEEAMRKVSGHG